MASDKKSKMPEVSITARLQRFQGRNALATSEMACVLDEAELAQHQDHERTE